MGQMVIVLVASLVAAQIVAVLIFAQDREHLLILANRDSIFDRSTSLARILSVTPPEQHSAVLAAARMRGFRAEIAERPTIDREREHRKNPIAREVLRRIRDLVPGPVLADIDDDDIFASRHRHDEHGRPMTLGMSIGIGPKLWLNLEHSLGPPPFWGLAPLIYAVLAALAVCLAAALMVRRITRPIRALADASDRFGRGEDVPPLPVRGPAELARASSAFNRMRERIRRFIDDRTRMLAAISHDLRTPITTLRLRAELMADGEDKDKILETLAEMELMTESTLAFARDDGKSEPMRATDFPALIESIADDLRDQGANITFEPGDRAVLSCRAMAVKRAIRNLIENAVRYGGRAVIALEEQGDHLTLIIEDDGPGIPENDLERVFEPFVRLEESRSTETGGHGLGLAIARSIIRGHGGDVILENRGENRGEGGLRVRVTLPRH